MLLAPDDGKVFSASDSIVLEWNWSGALAEDHFFVVEIAFPHEQAIWVDVHWVKETSFTVPAYLKDLMTGTRRCEWSVVIMRRTGVDKEGLPIGEPVSPYSAVRTFVWQQAIESTPAPAPYPPPSGYSYGDRRTGHLWTDAVFVTLSFFLGIVFLGILIFGQPKGSSG